MIVLDHPFSVGTILCEIGNIEFIPLDTKAAEDRYRLTPLDFLTADKVFDARWAMTLLDKTMGRMCKEYTVHGKASVFEVLKPFIDPINGKAALSYEQVANALKVSIGSVKKLISPTETVRLASARRSCVDSKRPERDR